MDLVLAYLVGAGTANANGADEFVLQLRSGDGRVLMGPESAVGGTPLAGATVSLSAEGPGVVQPTAQAETNEAGEARLKIPIRSFGPYSLVVGSVQAPDGTIYPFAPGTETATTFEVGEDCSLPPGF